MTTNKNDWKFGIILLAICSAEEPLNGATIENFQNSLVASAPRSLELAQC